MAARDEPVTLDPRTSVVYVVPDKMGGMMNIVANLVAFRDRQRFRNRVVLTHGRLSRDERFAQALDCDEQTVVEHSLPIENLHTVMRRVARAITPGPGVVVAGDLLDLATLSVHDTGRAVVLMLHGDTDYYYELAVRHEPVVHAFVAYSRRIYERLCEVLPRRADAIFHIEYGIAMPGDVRRPSHGPLRLIFAGRLEHGQKGILDLPPIDAALGRRGVDVRWTIVGSGPDGPRLASRWLDSGRVAMLGPKSNAEVLDLYVAHDVFVLPTRHEGFPVALLEAMAAGVVPVVSAIPSGVPEVVEDGATGVTPPVGDVEAFADAIAALATDRDRLERFSLAARSAVCTRFDIRERARAYEDLYSRFAALYRPLSDRARLQYGSRLDQPWIPNAAVRTMRTLLRLRSAR